MVLSPAFPTYSGKVPDSAADAFDTADNTTTTAARAAYLLPNFILVSPISPSADMANRSSATLPAVIAEAIKECDRDIWSIRGELPPILGRICCRFSERPSVAVSQHLIHADRYTQ